MSLHLSPETEQVKAKLHTNWNDLLNHARQLERERDEAREERDKLKQLLAADSENVDAYLGVCIERDEAREKVEQQRKEIVRLNGATNHAGGTPLKIALRERDEAREALMKIEDLFKEAMEEAK